jgi:8-oxo-dGTP pyrophosphatase MutT (NUDIX family)
MVEIWERLTRLPPVSNTPDGQAAVLVPLYEDDAGDVRLVLTKRHDWMRTHAGDVVFPGGKIDDEDEGPIAAALREAWEEVRIPVAAVEVIGGLQTIQPGPQGLLVVPVVARIQRPDELHPHPDEVDVIIEPTLTELLDDSSWQQRPLYGRDLWFYEFPEGTLWGATAFMVRELLDYLR